MSPYVTFKKSPELLGVTGFFAGYVKADWKAETLACTQVGSPAAAYDQYDLVVAYREIGHICSLYEAFGCKIRVCSQSNIHQLIEMNMDLRRVLLHTCYLIIIQYS